MSCWPSTPRVPYCLLKHELSSTQPGRVRRHTQAHWLTAGPAGWQADGPAPDKQCHKRTCPQARSSWNTHRANMTPSSLFVFLGAYGGCAQMFSSLGHIDNNWGIHWPLWNFNMLHSQIETRHRAKTRGNGITTILQKKKETSSCQMSFLVEVYCQTKQPAKQICLLLA